MASMAYSCSRVASVSESGKESSISMRPPDARNRSTRPLSATATLIGAPESVVSSSRRVKNTAMSPRVTAPSGSKRAAEPALGIRPISTAALIPACTEALLPPMSAKGECCVRGTAIPARSAARIRNSAICHLVTSQSGAYRAPSPTPTVIL